MAALRVKDDREVPHCDDQKMAPMVAQLIEVLFTDFTDKRFGTLITGCLIRTRKKLQFQLALGTSSSKIFACPEQI